MLFTSNIIGVLVALSSSVIWGGSDFSGGLATRRNNQWQVLILSTFSGLILLAVIALLLGESFPSPTSILWAVCAGLMGIIGLASLYKGLSLGETALVASTAAVIGTAIPVVFSIFVDGLPAPARLVGFGLAFLGIWLVSRTADHTNHVTRQGLLLSILAGVAFGLFFILITRVEPGKVITPLLVSRSTALVTSFFLLKLNHQPIPKPAGYPFAWLSGVLDASGNLLFLVAKQFGSLDTVVVLSSMYPMFTILLATWFLKEKISAGQWAGIFVCLASIALIAVG